MKIFLWLSTLLIFATPGLAANDLSLTLSCPDKNVIRPFIMMCGHNKYVAEQAQICADLVVESWQTASSRLIPMLQSRGKASNQNISEEDTGKNYQDTVNELIAQIKLMQHYTAVIAEYPQVMIDLGKSTGDSTSLSCFNDAFHKVQEIVTYLDNEIVRAKQIRQSTMTLRDIAQSRHQTLDNSLGSMIKGGVRSEPVPKGQVRRKSNTITGEIHKAPVLSPRP